MPAKPYRKQNRKQKLNQTGGKQVKITVSSKMDDYRTIDNFEELGVFLKNNNSLDYDIAVDTPNKAIDGIIAKNKFIGYQKKKYDYGYGIVFMFTFINFYIVINEKTNSIQYFYYFTDNDLKEMIGFSIMYEGSWFLTSLNQVYASFMSLFK